MGKGRLGSYSPGTRPAPMPPLPSALCSPGPALPAAPSLWSSPIFLPLFKPLLGSSLENSSGLSLPEKEFRLELYIHSCHTRPRPLNSPTSSFLHLAPPSGPPCMSWAFSFAACTPEVPPADADAEPESRSLQRSLPRSWGSWWLCGSCHVEFIRSFHGRHQWHTHSGLDAGLGVKRRRSQSPS